MAEIDLIEQVLGEKSYDVVIVTSVADNRINGLTLVWMTQVSFEPPQILIAVRKDTFTHDLISQGGCFAVNFLDEESMELARFFGSVSGREVDKFEQVPYTPGKTGAPLLDIAVAYLDCRVTGTFSASDHTLFVGEVVEGEMVRDAKILRYNKDIFYS